MNNTQLETTALQLKSLLTVLANIDPDNTTALEEAPTVAKIALEYAETLYCGIMDGNSKEV